MKRKTLIILTGLAIVAGGAVAVGAAGHRMHRMGGHFGGGHGGMEFGELGRMGGPMGGMLGRGMAGRLKALDTDKDGTVSLAEFLAGRTPVFERMDANKDGAIDAKDLEAAAKERTDYWAKVVMKRLDKDKDGKISKDEFSARAREGFSMRDLNDDGRIDGDDLPAGMRERARRWAEGRGPRGGGDHPGAPEGKGPGRGPFTLERLTGRMDEAFKRQDKNGDGFIDASEIAAGANERTGHRTQLFMKRFDANKDGKVTREEFDRFAKERFATLDLDDNGKISEEDLPPMMRGRGLLK